MTVRTLEYLNKRTDLRGLCVSWLFQLLGAFCSLRLSYFWWGLRLSIPHDHLQTRRENIHHIARFRDSQDFHKLGDLQVSLLFGIFVETAVAFSDIILTATSSALLNLWKRLQHHRLQNDGEDFRMAEFVLFTLQQSTAIYIVYLGLPLTGAYMNGVNAVIQTWGLGRASNPFYHITIYWFSPLLGLWAGKKTLEVIHALFKFWECRLQIPANGVLVSEIAAEITENSPNASENCYRRRNGLHSKSLPKNHPNGSSLHRSSECDTLLRTRRKSHTATNDSSMVNCGSNDDELRHRRHKSLTRNERVHL
ncbi:unnamed protein product [Rodentolepis nana]|uniref:Uncharacterized protein n=1 Tax=Rodentolepis nana TaxID=102285 RepID=A0A0R3TZR3_RODNA|nr:unnamed protein product [Rodentolepis nana]